VIRIGDFSSLTRLSIKTLRYYDETGLLKPVRVDPSTGYRYYSATQLPRLHRILALKDLGFPLDQIAQILDGGVSAEELRGMLRLRQAEQAARVQQESERLTRLQSILRLIEQENTMGQDVVVKEVGPQWIASVRDVIPTYQSVGMLYGEVYGLLGRSGCPGGLLPVALWHDKEFKETDVDGEAGVYLPKPIEPAGRVKVYELPGVTVASIIHAGAFQTLNSSYRAVAAWMGANGYSPTGPARELYLKIGEQVRPDDESYITEIQIPVEKNAAA
jgi:DNA-binding transcriptional MerR regulator